MKANGPDFEGPRAGCGPQALVWPPLSYTVKNHVGYLGQLVDIDYLSVKDFVSLFDNLTLSELSPQVRFSIQIVKQRVNQYQDPARDQTPN